MRYKSVAIFVTIFAVLFPSSIFAATPKAGATCLKVGATQIASGKKFTCIKSGKKLVWNKGVLLKKPATEITKPNQTSNQEATTINSSTQPENSNSQNAQPPLQSGTNCETLGKITTVFMMSVAIILCLIP